MSEIYSNRQILDWVGYFTEKMDISPDQVKILDVCSKKRNVIPSIETHKWVLIFADEGQKGLCYQMWEAGLGECQVWHAEGMSPDGGVKNNTVKDLIDYEIKTPTVLFVSNQNARDSYKIGMKNENFSRGTVHYVGNEIRAVIMSMLAVDTQDVICIVNGESIAVEAAVIAGEGTIEAVETVPADMATLAENVEKFGLTNIEIVSDTAELIKERMPVPRLSFIVAGNEMEEQIRDLLNLNPKMQFIIWTVELDMLSKARMLFEKYHIKNTDTMQITVSKMNKSSMFVAQPSPWMISGEAM